MTLTDFLSMPKGMDMITYEQLLKDRKRLEKQIAKANSVIYDEEDSLEILADEVGSERYNKHLESKQKAEDKRIKAQSKLSKVVEKLYGGFTNEHYREHKS
jgi:hypothetical protein